MMLKTVFSLPVRLLWGLLGVTTLATLIWLLGPLLSFTRFHLADSRLIRQLLIGLCYLLWILLQLIPLLRRARFNSRLHSLLQRGHHASAELQAIGEMLDNSFNEALQQLKKIQFSRCRWQRLSTQYLYQLPWYLILGAPGAGKTTALLNAGLELPLSENDTQGARHGTGATRHCDWWFTRQALLLDTAGRYTLQESQRTRDACEWQTFVSLLKRHRPRQPINGVIITLSVSDLLSDSAQARRTQASALRSRLAELHQQTGIYFPVYIMVTKSDLLKGFIRYFARLDKHQREQVLGFTFSCNAGRHPAEPALRTQFTQQFDRLCARLMADLADNMAAESDLTLRAACFQFPQEFASLGSLLTEYLDIIFATQQGELPWSPRGLFFTSGTQEGLPFDRVMGELARKLQLPQPQRPLIARWNSVNRHAQIPTNKSQSFFIHDMFNAVILRETGLASSDRGWEQRNRLLHRLGYAALALSLLFCCSLWFISYTQNQRYLQQVAQRLPGVTQSATALSADNHGEIVDLLPFLNRLAALPGGEDFPLDAPPLRLRAGLYRGDEVADAAWDLYQDALKALLLPRVEQLIARALRSDSGVNAESRQRALHAYQMLYQLRNDHDAFLRTWVIQNLRRSAATTVTEYQLKQLDWHLSQLFDYQQQRSAAYPVPARPQGS